MARPSEGLGEAFSCRLPTEYDELARKERDESGMPLSVSVRSWVDGYFRHVHSKSGAAAEQNWQAKYYRVKKRLERLQARLAGVVPAEEPKTVEAANG